MRIATMTLLAAFVFSASLVAPAAGPLGIGEAQAAKKAAKKKVGPGLCGTMNYWDKKTKKCATKAK